jgi:hypothetical protein
MEIFENFSTGSLETGFSGSTYDGWSLHRGTSLSVIQFGGERVFAGKTADSGSKRMARPLVEANSTKGGWRIQAKWKISSNVAADYSAANNFYDLGVMIDSTDVTNITGANKRSIMLSYEGAGSNVGIKIWNGTNNVKILDVTAIPTNQWLTVTLAGDNSGRYTGTVQNAAGAIIAADSRDVLADANKQLYAFVDFGYTQNANQNTWGTQVVMKDIIARDDLSAYDELTQRRNLHIAPTVNGGDICYVHIPKDWKPDVDNTKVIIAGHGYNATIGFTTSMSGSLPDGGYIYAISNTHGNTWGNNQAISDLEEMRKWIVAHCGGSEKVYLNGFSMGNLVALNYIARYRDKVRAHVGEIGVCSLKNLYDNATFTASIQTAYGVTRFADIPVIYDPIRNVEKYVDVPMMMWAGTSDTTVPHGLNTLPFVDKLSKLGGMVMYIEEPGETHTLDVDPDRYLDFYNAFNANSKTIAVKMEPFSAYKIENSGSGTVSYLIDTVQGNMTSMVSKEEVIYTENETRTILVKTTGNRSDITVTKIN